MNIKRCPRCSNLNISVDLSTGILSCGRCKYNGKKVKTNTFNELTEEFEKNNSVKEEK